MSVSVAGPDKTRGPAFGYQSAKLLYMLATGPAARLTSGLVFNECGYHNGHLGQTNIRNKLILKER